MKPKAMLSAFLAGLLAAAVLATAVVAKWEGELLSESDAEVNAKALDEEANATLAHPAHA